MCGIIGYWTDRDMIDGDEMILAVTLINEAKVRGLHSNGVTALNEYGATKTKKWIGGCNRAKIVEVIASCKSFIHHHRYSTSGDYLEPANNQPIDIGKISVVANSVLSMKPKNEYEQEFDVKCVSDNDTEIFARWIEEGRDPIDLIRKGDGSFAGLYYNNNKLFALRNNKRPLWYFSYSGSRWVVSTADIARRAFKRLNLGNIDLVPLEPFSVYPIGELKGK